MVHVVLVKIIWQFIQLKVQVVINYLEEQFQLGQHLVPLIIHLQMINHGYQICLISFNFNHIKHLEDSNDEDFKIKTTYCSKSYV